MCCNCFFVQFEIDAFVKISNGGGCHLCNSTNCTIFKLKELTNVFWNGIIKLLFYLVVFLCIKIR